MQVRRVQYARVSSEDQRDRETIQTQLDQGREYERRHGFKFLAVYADDGISGTVPAIRRPEAQRLIRDAHARLFDEVWVTHTSRVARDILEYLLFEDALRRSNVKLLSMTQPFEVDTPTGRFLRTQLAAAGQLERDNIVMQSRWGMERLARAGRWNGGKPPFGYLVKDGRLEINPGEARVVRLIFRLYLGGRGTVGIAEHLTARKIPIPINWRFPERRVSGKWTPSRVGEILKHTAYDGEFTWRRRHAKKRDGQNVGWVKAAAEEQISFRVPPIINHKDFVRVQELLKENRNMARRNMKRFYLLRGLIHCGSCGRGYTGGGSVPDGNYYYRCFYRAQNSRNCRNPNVRAEVLEEMVWAQLKSIVGRPGPVIKALGAELRSARRGVAAIERESEGLGKLIAEKERERERVIQLRRRGTISEDEAERELNQIREEQEQLQAERTRISQGQALGVDLDGQLTELRELLLKVNNEMRGASPQKRYDLLHALIERITVKPAPGKGPFQAEVEVTYFGTSKLLTASGGRRAS